MLKFGETFGPCIGPAGYTWTAPAATHPVCASAGLQIEVDDVENNGGSDFVARVKLTTQAATPIDDSFYAKLYFSYDLLSTDITKEVRNKLFY